MEGLKDTLQIINKRAKESNQWCEDEYKDLENFLQELNNKEEASKSMITFLVINTSGLTLIPTTILSLRNYYGSSNPGKIILPCILVTLLSTIISLIIDYIFRKVTHD